MSQSTDKRCFVICPIGDEGTPTRAWSDDILNSLLRPIAKEFNYITDRAIDGSRPSEITTNVIADIIKADLVIADLTFHNANVFYELALRHARGTPFFHVAEIGTKIPFDISTINTVFIDRSTFAATDKTRSELRRHFQSVQDGSASYDNPVKRHQQKLKADQSGDPIEKRLIALEEQLAAVQRDDRQVVRSGTAKSNQNRFAATNSDITKQLDERISDALVGRRFNFVFNPVSGKSKILTFDSNGLIGEGRNGNESSWQIADGRLEIYNSDRMIYSRFIYSDGDQIFRHTNDPDLPSIKGQFFRPV